LSAGHIYYVRFNEDTKNLRIEEAYFEFIPGAKQEDDEE
jgi:hypothetical protein